MNQSTTLNTLLSLVQASRGACWAPQLLNQVVDQMLGWLEDRFEEFSYLEGEPSGEKVLNSIELFHLSLQYLVDYQRSPSKSKLEKVLLLAYQAEDQLSELTDSPIFGSLLAA